MSNEGQSSKKCSVSSIPSFVGHIGFIVSKIVPEFVKVEFSETDMVKELSMLKRLSSVKYIVSLNKGPYN